MTRETVEDILWSVGLLLALVIVLGIIWDLNAQEAPKPIYVGGGIALNKVADSPWNLWSTAIYPAAGGYLSTTTDWTPQQVIVGGKYVTGFAPSLRQGYHRPLWSNGKFDLLAGGDVGIGLTPSQAAAQVSFAGSVTATAIWHASNRFVVAFAPRGMRLNGVLFFVPQLGILVRLK